MESRLPEQVIVLWGAGHTNAHVLRMWRMHALPGAQLVCISDSPWAAYSGMLPGTLAKLYQPDEMRIDLVRLCSAAGVLLLLEEVTGLDVAARQLLFAARPPLPFDVLSIGIGSVPDCSIVAQGDPSVVTIKPMQTFLDRLDERLRQLRDRGPSAPLRVAVLGAGAAGLEITLCLPGWLKQHDDDWDYQITLIDGGDSIGGGLSTAAANVARRELERRSVHLHLGQRAERISGGAIQFDAGDSLPFDLILLTTSATAPTVLNRLNLPVDERGFLLTRKSLRTTADLPVFVVGDSGTIASERLPKAGVYAVRQAPVLWKNIQRQLRGEPLLDYKPQRQFLRLLNTGDHAAIADYLGFAWKGRSCWIWKDFIDRRFIRKYQDYQRHAMRRARDDTPPEPMRCTGCGGKVAGQVLSAVLSKLDVPAHGAVPLGLRAADDAAVVALPAGSQAVMSVDFFAPPLDDLYLVGRIAALNAASDLFAMGATPVAALASVTLPQGTARAQEQVLYELLAGGLTELKKMGATLAGGHTIEGPRVTIGFNVLGADQGRLRTKAGLLPATALVLTKPLGIGTLLAAHGRGECRAEWLGPLIDTMLQSNGQAAALFDEFEIQAATDVTGFGLAGHLLEMLRASAVRGRIAVASVPLLPGARALLAAGKESTMAAANRSAETDIDCAAVTQLLPEYAALFDPQTSGGLLLGVPENRAQDFCRRLHTLGYTDAAVLGATVPLADNDRRTLELI